MQSERAMYAEILARFLAAGVQFISLEEAMADPMNCEAVPIITPRFLNQVQKWALLKGVAIEGCPPAILAEMDRIAQLCFSRFTRRPRQTISLEPN